MGKILIIKDADFSAVYVDKVTPMIGVPVISIDTDGSVTITCNNATAIYYTTDGSTPTTSSTKYTASFTISSGVVVKTIATFSNGSTSNVVSKAYNAKVYLNNTDYSAWVAYGSSASTIKFDTIYGIPPVTAEQSISGCAVYVPTGSVSGDTVTMYKISPASAGGTLTLLKTLTLDGSTNVAVDFKLDETITLASGEAVGCKFSGTFAYKENTPQPLGYRQYNYSGTSVTQVYGSDTEVPGTHWIGLNFYE